ncbi:MAG TPA: 30S ribosomal protein S9 [Candidatus Paceibacterota bacterium]
MATINNKEEKYTESVGKRKSAIARVRIYPASKMTFLINDKPLERYFPGMALAHVIKLPISVSGTEEKFRINVVVRGGGVRAQAEAISLGISRALSSVNPNLRQPLKKAKLLSRNSRIKERRKFGLKKARKAPQWSKR